VKKLNLTFIFCLAVYFLSAQDYLITFLGSGEINTVSTVVVENMTQGKSLTLNGSDILHLKSTVTEISDIIYNHTDGVQFYPNPMKEYSNMEFALTEGGVTNIELFDLAGRKLIQTQNYLNQGRHSYRITGVGNGIYVLKVTAGNYIFSGKLTSNRKTGELVKIEYQNSIPYKPIPLETKSANSEIIMQYNTGDVLKFTGTSGIYSTITTDIPKQSKTLAFTFIPCTDVDGNNYQVLQIGTQFWMSENLNVTKYNDGTNIPNGKDDLVRRAINYGAYRNYNDKESYATTYGRLYNWHAVNTGKLAPKGWQVPSDDDWSTLIAFMGGEGIAGGKLKATGSKWGSPNTGATNESGFTGLPGCKTGDTDGGYYNIGTHGLWWTSSGLTGNYKDYALSYLLSYDESSCDRGEEKKIDGLSVRCIRASNILGVNTISASSLTNNSAILGGYVTNDGWGSITERGICYTTNINPSITNNKIAIGNGFGNFNKTISGLIPNTTYYVRAYATNNTGTVYGNEVSFTTFTGTVTDIDGNIYNTVTIGSQVWMAENLKTTKFNDGAIIPNVTLDSDWGNLLSPGYCWYNNDVGNKNIYGGLYNWYAGNTGKLAPAGWHIPTKEEWRKLYNSVGYGLKESGSTHWLYNNTEATNNTGFTALPGGYRYNKYDGIGLMGYWLCYEPNSVFLLDELGTIMGIKFEGIMSLLSDTRTHGYSVRCIKDDTNVAIPTVNTMSATSITSTSAKVSCEITNIGGSSVLERGFYWGTSANPEINGEKLEIENGTGIGIFTSDLSALNPNTTYYIKAYATNSFGIAYSNQVSFSTTGETAGTVTDIDGNIYNTIAIGTQVWMVENLKTTRYKDGTNIPHITNDDVWALLTSSGYCWYNNNINNKNTYGALYNWEAVKTGKLAPQGWHVPTDVELIVLANYLGGEDIAGGKLKETGTSHWASPNTGANNDSKFSALPGGLRFFNGSFDGINLVGLWWSSSEKDTNDAWYRYLSNEDIRIDRNINGKMAGLSVRCIKD